MWDGNGQDAKFDSRKKIVGVHEKLHSKIYPLLKPLVRRLRGCNVRRRLCLLINILLLDGNDNDNFLVSLRSFGKANRTALRALAGQRAVENDYEHINHAGQCSKAATKDKTDCIALPWSEN